MLVTLQQSAQKPHLCVTDCNTDHYYEPCKIPGTETFNPLTDKIHFLSPLQLCIATKNTDAPTGYDFKTYRIEKSYYDSNNSKVTEDAQA